MKSYLMLSVTAFALALYAAPTQLQAAANPDHANQKGIDNSAESNAGGNGKSNAGGNGKGKGKGHGEADENHGGKHDKWSE